MDPLTEAGEAARAWHGRLLALLAAGTGDIPAAEDALADAYEAAVRTWPEQGVPGNPGGWLLTVARNRLRDRWRAAEFRRTVPLDVDRDAPAHLDDVDVDAVPDRRLELMLVCAHPAIDRAMHTPLMLNTVLGFTAEQVGRAFSVPATTMATRLVRVKKRIRTTGIPFRIPDRDDLPGRMTAVLEAVYGTYVIDRAEALHLAEVLAGLAPDDPEVHGRTPAPARTDGSCRWANRTRRGGTGGSSSGRTGICGRRTRWDGSAGSRWRRPSRRCTARGRRMPVPCWNCI
jgi:RNA polymerase sigma-70 factor (ECF subfamily)